MQVEARADRAFHRVAPERFARTDRIDGTARVRHRLFEPGARIVDAGVHRRDDGAVHLRRIPRLAGDHADPRVALERDLLGCVEPDERQERVHVANERAAIGLRVVPLGKGDRRRRLRRGGLGEARQRDDLELLLERSHARGVARRGRRRTSRDADQ